MECVTSRWPRPGKFKSAYSLTRMRPSFASVMLPSGIFQSTHSLTECDTAWQSRLVTSEYFNPRTPSQNATIIIIQRRQCLFISIHALPHRMRPRADCGRMKPLHFNPRTPSQNATAKITKFFSIPFNFLSLLYPSSLENSTIIFSPHHISP